METELKFALSPEARSRIERHVRASGGEPVVENVQSTYFDTDDHILQKLGFSLRLRQKGSTYVQTVKSTGNGTYQRQEWEWPVPTDHPARDRLADVPGLGVVSRVVLAEGTLRPLFRTEVKRARLDLKPADGTRIELAIDEGKIVAGERSEPLSELELELKAGSGEWLFRQALNLLQVAPLSLLNESKAQRGYQLLDGNGPSARKADHVECDDSFTLGEAFRRLSAAILEHLLSNQAATLRGDEHEGIHQMRIAVRRLRSLLLLFEPLIEAHARKRFEEDFRRLGQVLGKARDWDVFLNQSLPQAVRNKKDTDSFEPIRELASQRQHAAHQAAKKAVLEPSFSSLVLAFQAWSRHGAGAVDPDYVDRPLKKSASGMLSRLAGRVGKRLSDIDENDAESLHRLRKSAKKLRYGLEFFRGLYGKKAKTYYKRCDALQMRLGDLNDLASLTRLATELSGEGRTELAPALRSLESRSDAMQEKKRKRLNKVLRRFRHQDSFWR
jgi:inorganic triphosphatase YgiF